MAGEDLLRQIDEQGAVRAESHFETEEMLKHAGQLVMQVAAQEVTYELASQADLGVNGINLTQTADEIAINRTALSGAIDLAIEARKRVLRAEHEQRLLREQLIADI